MVQPSLCAQNISTILLNIYSCSNQFHPNYIDKEASFKTTIANFVSNQTFI